MLEYHLYFSYIHIYVHTHINIFFSKANSFTQDSNSGHQHKHDITANMHEYDARDACRDLMFEEGEEPNSNFKATVLNLKVGKER